MGNESTTNGAPAVRSTAGLSDALRGLMKLLDDGDLVRNTDGDGDAMVFLRQGVRIADALRAAQEALGSEKSYNPEVRRSGPDANQ